MAAGKVRRMLTAFQVVAVLLVAAAMAPALAHALELPGKMRLTKDEYFAVQAIYYPGFTIAGLSEPAGILVMLVLLFLLLFLPMLTVLLLFFFLLPALPVLIIHCVKRLL